MPVLSSKSSGKRFLECINPSFTGPHDNVGLLLTKLIIFMVFSPMVHEISIPLFFYIHQDHKLVILLSMTSFTPKVPNGSAPF